MNNNVVEFFVKMKDMMSGGLVKLGQQANTTFKNIQNNTKAAERQTGFLTHSVSELSRRLTEVNKVRFGTVLKSEFKAATNEAKALEREIARLKGGSRVGRGIGSGLMGIGRMIMPYVGAAAIGSFAMSSVKAANEFGAQKQSYQVLTGNEGIGSALADNLRSLKENTIMGPAVYKNAQTMLGFGIAAKDVTKDLRMLGDVSMGNANRLQRLTLAFSEVQAAGKLSGKEVRQFVNAGFNPLQEIAKITGKSLAVVREEMHKGGISAEMLTGAFQSATGEGGRFHGMLEKMAETGQGKMQKLIGQWASFKIAFGERLQPLSNSGTDTLSRILHWAKELVEIPVTQKLQETINKIRGLQSELTSSNTSHQRQINILHELEQINPNIVKGINEQAISYKDLAKNIDNVTGSLRAKIFAENFTKANVDVLTQYSKAQSEQSYNEANALSIVGQVSPDIAQNPNLSLGMKQMLAKKELMKRVGTHGKESNQFGRAVDWFKNPNTGQSYRINDESKDNINLMDLGTSIFQANKAAFTIRALSPQVAQINKTKEALMKQFDQYAGIDSMSTAAGIKTGKGGAGGASSAAEGGNTVGSSITSGGPRTINIHGVKFTDKIEIHASSTDEGLHQMEKKMDEMLLRILNSGASVQ